MEIGNYVTQCRTLVNDVMEMINEILRFHRDAEARTEVEDS
jgi:hypothetical protein